MLSRHIILIHAEDSSSCDEVPVAFLVRERIATPLCGPSGNRFPADGLPLKYPPSLLLLLQANIVNVLRVSVKLNQTEEHSRGKGNHSREGEVEPEIGSGHHLEGHAPKAEEGAVKGGSADDRDDDKPDQNAPPDKHMHDRVPEESVQSNLCVGRDGK